MQEEVENRTLTLTVNATKFTGRVLKAALSKYLAHRKNKKLQNSRDSPDGVKPYGRVSMEDLKKQYGDMKEIDLQDKGLRSFDRIAREYKVQYAVYKTAKGQYQKFFKAPSEASMNAAFQKYSKPFMDPVFENNIILTQTERLTMNSRPKDPRTARNKNVLIIGGSGSGKTRFWLKPNLMQCTSKTYPTSFVVTDPKGLIC